MAVLPSENKLSATYFCTGGPESNMLNYDYEIMNTNAKRRKKNNENSFLIS